MAATAEEGNLFQDQCRRVCKMALSGFTNGTSSITNTTAYLYDGWNLVAELIHNPPCFAHATQSRQSEIRNSYTWGLDLSGTLQGAGGIAGLLSCSFGLQTSDCGLPCYDGNGNVMALVDAADGSVEASYEYDPFGNTLRATGAKAAANPLRFSTKYTDDETGLVYYGFRYYHPEMGRWMSRDPIGSLGGPSPYAMLSNRPLLAADYLGTVEYDFHPQSIEAMGYSFVPIKEPGTMGYTYRLAGAECRCGEVESQCCKLRCTLYSYDQIFIKDILGIDTETLRQVYSHEQRHVSSFRERMRSVVGSMLENAERSVGSTPCLWCEARLPGIVREANDAIEDILFLERNHRNPESPPADRLDDIPPLEPGLPPVSMPPPSWVIPITL